MSTWQLIGHYLGPIADLLTQPGITEICVNRYDEIFIEREGRLLKIETTFASEHEVATLIKCIAHALGVACHEETHPIVEARLQDGARICGVLYPTATRGSTLTIRLFPKIKVTAADLLASATLDAQTLQSLQQAVAHQANILISGSTGSGKTTLLNILCGFLPAEERVITIEDTQELHLPVSNWVAFEARTKKTSTMSLATLIKATLRMRPNRLIVGEVRDSAAADALFQAAHTGHCVFSTIHANSARDALMRLQTLILETKNLPYHILKEQLEKTIHMIVHLTRTETGRRVEEVVTLSV